MSRDETPQGAVPIAADALAAHIEECRECRDSKLPIEPVVALLQSVEVDLDAAALSQRTLHRLGPEIERLAAAASWRRLVAVVLLSLLPLPAVAAYDAYLLSAVYSAVSVLLPAGLAAYLVLSYTALLVFLFAATYAAIPLLVMRRAPQRAPAFG